MALMELSSIKKPVELDDVFVVRTQIEGIYDRLIAYFFIRDKVSTALSDSFIEGFNCCTSFRSQRKKWFAHSSLFFNRVLTPLY